MESNLYAFSYDNAFDLYTVRGVVSEETEFLPRQLTHIPEELLNQMEKNYRFNHTTTPKREISFSDSKLYAIVDFNGRKFSSEEITNIFNSQNNTIQLTK